MFVGDLRLGPLDVFALKLGYGLVQILCWTVEREDSMVGMVYLTAWVLIKWHDILVNIDCRRYAHLSYLRKIN